jgi:hypothetical protein
MGSTIEVKIKDDNDRIIVIIKRDSFSCGETGQLTASF